MATSTLRNRIAKLVMYSTLLLASGSAYTTNSFADEASAPSADSSPTEIKPESASIVIPDAGTLGGDVTMHADVYKPAGPGPFPTLIFSHGRDADRFERAKLEHPVSIGHVKYWLKKGFAVVAPVRVGYGVTGGPDRENSGSWFDDFGNCTRTPNFRAVAKATVQSTLAALNWARAQPWVDANRIVLEGVSLGGFATVSTVATRSPGVIGYINFSGGAGGMPDRAPNRSCDKQQMKDVMGELGKTSTAPGLWLYAANDHFWGPDAPHQWYDAFAAGGDPAEFVGAGELPGHDGHFLLKYGGKMWSVHVDRFVKQLGL
ncbi:alpha/beta hydrolase family protein [Burkholderia ubonensis]|uniref:Dipeptidyl aminopeptidase n=1 Tax=Burkholderia ubonensis TaxID=101571 RepID=A0AAW3NKW4_9BURK|nr:CocE/NonD family hydrolase [Burkholderia ubonensis]KVT62522.1 dipeptidyl aminopeptidase [Burkholderia ubonensis]